MQRVIKNTSQQIEVMNDRKAILRNKGFEESLFDYGMDSNQSELFGSRVRIVKTQPKLKILSSSTRRKSEDKENFFS